MSNPVRYTHVRQKRLNYTIAYTFTKNADGELDIAYGVAQCRPNDTFVRSVGRNFAEGRLRKALTGPDKQDLMYGSFKAKDEPGVPVSKLVRDTYESDRKLTLAACNVQSLAVQNALAELRKVGINF